MLSLPEKRKSLSLGKKRAFFSLLLLFIVIIGYSYYLYQQNYLVIDQAELGGTVILVSSPIGGKVIGLHAYEGQIVEKNQILLEFDPNPFMQALTEAQNNLALVQNGQMPNPTFAAPQTSNLITAFQENLSNLRQNENQAKQEYEYWTQLHSTALLAMRNPQTPSKELENYIIQEGNAKLMKESAQIRLEQASQARAKIDAELQSLMSSQRSATTANSASIQIWQERVKQAYLALEHTKILAPQEGTITGISIQINDIATSHQPLLHLMSSNSTQFYISAFASIAQSSRLRIGQEGELALPEQNIRAIISQLTPTSEGSMVTLVPQEKLSPQVINQSGKLTIHLN